MTTLFSILKGMSLDLQSLSTEELGIIGRALQDIVGVVIVDDLQLSVSSVDITLSLQLRIPRPNDVSSAVHERSS